MLRNIESQSEMKKKYQNFNKNKDDIPLEVNNIDAEELNKSVEYEYSNPFSNINHNSKVDKSNNNIINLLLLFVRIKNIT